MANNIFSLARMTVSSSGTGTITLNVAVSGFLTFDLAGCSTAAAGQSVTYAIQDTAQSEIARGTYFSSSRGLTRGSSTTGLKSTNSDSPINMSNTAQVFITPSARDFLQAGVVMVFYQSAAPTGWTQTVVNDRALRVTSGGGGVVGGTSPFSTVFAITATNSYVLLEADIPSHFHGSVFRPSGIAYTGVDFGASGASNLSFGDNTLTTTGNTGGGGGHSHGIDLRVQFADVIFASKD